MVVVLIGRTRFQGWDHLIGIDGGGTGTRAKLLDVDGVLLGSGEAGPSALAQGLEQAWTHIGEAIARAFATADLALPPMRECAVGMGLSGVHSQARRDASPLDLTGPLRRSGT